MDRSRLFFRGEMLPLGIVYADACGFDSLGRKGDWGKVVKGIGIAKDFVDRYGSRKDILITREIYAEFGGLIGYYKARLEEFEYSLDFARDSNCPKKEISKMARDVDVAREGVDLYEGLRSRLLNNFHDISRVYRGDAARFKVEGFLDGFDIHDGERSLLVDMFSHKGVSSFYSADSDALGACRECFLKFRRLGSICDARSGVVADFKGRR